MIVELGIKKRATDLSKTNMFYDNQPMVDYLQYHLEEYGNTCINYNYVERFGVEKVAEDLTELGYRCQVRVDASLCPDSIYDFEYDHNRRIRMVFPILPAVLIFWKDYVESI